jgi:hypothetical protein
MLFLANRHRQHNRSGCLSRTIRRWLDHVNAVFVTVERKHGTKKPKPLRDGTAFSSPMPLSG